MTMIIDGTNGLTFPDTSKQYNSYYSFKNRIINGAMMIDQRNAGAAITVNSSSEFFPVDRFVAAGQTADGVFTLQRSTVAPAGFINSLLATVTTADSSIGATQFYFLQQKIEGFNVADLGFGTANASTVTLSFWVRSSVTGTFGGSLSNSAANRSYPFTYTINAANTFEYKTVTIAGDTSGTWLTDNGVGLRVYFNIGAGSSYTATAGAWASQWAFNATGATNLISTNGATFYITGVQLEKGSTATSFDYRPYGTEEILCYRYAYVINTTANNDPVHDGYCANSGTLQGTLRLPVNMRAAPTLSYTNLNKFTCAYSGGSSVVTGINLIGYGTISGRINWNPTGSPFTGGQGAMVFANGTGGQLVFSSEL